MDNLVIPSGHSRRECKLRLNFGHIFQYKQADLIIVKPAQGTFSSFFQTTENFIVHGLEITP